MLAYAVRNALAVLGVMLLAGALAHRVAHRLRVPPLAVTLAFGIALGAFHLVRFGPGALMAAFLVTLGAGYILFTGGVEVDGGVLGEVALTVGLLATLGVLLTAGVVGLAAHALLGLPWSSALLLGAVVAPTDPAALIPLFRQTPVRPRLSQALVAEAAFNDPVSAMLVTAALAMTGAQAMAPDVAVGLLAGLAGLGLIGGAGAGLLGLMALSAKPWALSEEMAPLVCLIQVTLGYAAVEAAGGSGLLAVFMAGLVMGNGAAFGMPLPEGALGQLRSVSEHLSREFAILVFIILGSRVDLGALALGFWPRAGVVLTLIVVARPLAVALCALPDRRARWQWQELAFLAWGRETGVMAAVLAGLVGFSHSPYSRAIESTVVLAILVTLGVQATLTPWLAGRLGLAGATGPLPGAG